MAAVQKKMEDLGLKILATDLKKSIPQSASNKGKKSANKKSNSEDSDSSEYLLDDDDQGDSDDDDTESDDQPQPLATKVDSLTTLLSILQITNIHLVITLITC